MRRLIPHPLLDRVAPYGPSFPPQSNPFSGLSEADMHKPQVGISSMWYEGNPCNMHLLRLAEEVKKGVVSSNPCHTLP
jgi:hypothetical protein